MYFSHFKNTDWAKCVTTAFGEIQGVGAKLLKPTENMPLLWGSVGKNSRAFKAIDKMQVKTFISIWNQDITG